MNKNVWFDFAVKVWRGRAESPEGHTVDGWFESEASASFSMDKWLAAWSEGSPSGAA